MLNRSGQGRPSTRPGRANMPPLRSTSSRGGGNAQQQGRSPNPNRVLSPRSVTRHHPYSTGNMIDSLRTDLRKAKRKLKEQEEEHQETIAECEEQIKAHKITIKSYRLTFEDKGQETSELKQTIKDLETQLAAGNRGSQWRLANVLPGSKVADQKLEQLSKEFKMKEEDYKKQIQILQDQKTTLAHNANIAKQKLQNESAKFVKELQELQGMDTFKKIKVSDTEIQQQWKALAFLVRQFVSTHLPDFFSTQDLHELNAQGVLASTMGLCADPHSILQSPVACPKLLECVIWHFLYVNIFSVKSKFWAGKVGRSASLNNDNIYRTLTGLKHGDREASMSAFHDLRARTAGFITQLKLGGKEINSESYADLLLAAVYHYRHGTAMTEDSSDLTVNADALEIIEAAADLDEIFRSSKAHYTVFLSNVEPPYTPPFFDYAFVPEMMVYALQTGSNGCHQSEASQLTVDLAVSPGLIKSGDSNGTNYNTERVLIKLETVCNINDVLGPKIKEEFAEAGMEGAIKLPELPDDLEGAGCTPRKQLATQDMVMVDLASPDTPYFKPMKDVKRENA